MVPSLGSCFLQTNHKTVHQPKSQTLFLLTTSPNYFLLTTTSRTNYLHSVPTHNEQPILYTRLRGDSHFPLLDPVIQFLPLRLNQSHPILLLYVLQCCRRLQGLVRNVNFHLGSAEKRTKKCTTSSISATCYFVLLCTTLLIHFNPLILL